MSFLFRKKPAKKYDYFEKPDGQDTHMKLWCVMKPTAIVALGLGTADVLAWSQPKGYIRTIGRYCHVGWPVLGVSAAFVLTSNILGSIRNKDDQTNWFAGGFAAGAIIGAWSRRPMVGFNMGMLMGGFAALLKDSCVQNYRMFPDPATFRVKNGDLWSVHNDFSLIKERPRNWVTKAE